MPKDLPVTSKTKGLQFRSAIKSNSTYLLVKIDAQRSANEIKDQIKVCS